MKTFIKDNSTGCERLLDWQNIAFFLTSSYENSHNISHTQRSALYGVWMDTEGEGWKQIEGRRKRAVS